MEMCYDGALVMPSSYALMDEEEMCYTEGGVRFTVSKDRCASIATYIYALLGVAGGTIGISALKDKLTSCIATVGKFIKKVCSTSGGLIGIVIGTIAAVLVTTNGVSFCVGCVTADRKDKACTMSWYGAGFGNFSYT